MNEPKPPTNPWAIPLLKQWQEEYRAQGQETILIVDRHNEWALKLLRPLCPQMQAAQDKRILLTQEANMTKWGWSEQQKHASRWYDQLIANYEASWLVKNLLSWNQWLSIRLHIDHPEWAVHVPTHADPWYAPSDIFKYLWTHLT